MTSLFARAHRAIEWTNSLCFKVFQGHLQSCPTSAIPLSVPTYSVVHQTRKACSSGLSSPHRRPLPSSSASNLGDGPAAYGGVLGQGQGQEMLRGGSTIDAGGSMDGVDLGSGEWTKVCSCVAMNYVAEDDPLCNAVSREKRRRARSRSDS